MTFVYFPITYGPGREAGRERTVFLNFVWLVSFNPKRNVYKTN